MNLSNKQPSFEKVALSGCLPLGAALQTNDKFRSQPIGRWQSSLSREEDGFRGPRAAGWHDSAWGGDLRRKIGTDG